MMKRSLIGGFLFLTLVLCTNALANRFDAETGLMYYKNRYHSTALGRFVSRDPIGYNAGSLGLYEYVGSRSTYAVDPFGLSKYVFDGKKLCCISDDGTKCIKCWKARSGRPTDLPPLPGDTDRYPPKGGATGDPQTDYINMYDTWLDTVFDYSVKRQKEKSTGPLPSGKYTFDCANLIDFGTFGWVRRQKYPSTAWGDYAVRLEADEGTETYGRSGFHIHGGDDFGSAGCIDLTCGDKSFFKDDDCKCNGKKELIVDFTGNSTPKDCVEPAKCGNPVGPKK
jgi:RHS repeat-associated protein